MILLVGAMAAFGPLCIDMYLPALPDISDDLAASASSVQLSLTACLIGLGAGQLLIGPLSDRLGRRRPLCLGLALFVVASCACAFAPSIAVLIALRLLQGLGGAAGIVISRAVVRDLYSGATAARFFSLLMLVTGAGPILAPQVGALVLSFAPWRGIFLALSVAGSVLLLIAALRLPETLDASNRNAGGLRVTLSTMRAVATHRTFVANAVVCGLGFGSIFAYVAGSSFVVQNVYGLSAQAYGVVFAVNAVGLVTASQINGRLVGRLGSTRLMTAGLIGLASGGVCVLIVVSTGLFGIGGLIAAMLIVMSSNGFIAPNAMALAMNDFPESAGSASALLGLLQFSIGASVAPLVGLGGSNTGVPMGIIMATMGLAALSLRLALHYPSASGRLSPAPDRGSPVG
ncbi:MAG: drug resistance transporter, Bcr/CflA subfamily [Pseudonocardiales bacterium]|nr:drug resistance transporter, Bcr/CflA subfamily [Jatrophihabitantaceae bacterium]MCW2603164.1 drug resistance transporter, Bcr/CflA subfamily [Pseudonocardiales bacterium]